MPYSQASVIEQPATRTVGEDQLVRWGNAVYADLALGESVEHEGDLVTLREMSGDTCVVTVDGQHITLTMARRGLPTIIGQHRLFLADTREAAALTTDDHVHASTTRDALLCLSSAYKPLLDPERFTFPVSRRDGFHWRMAEESHMHAYLGWANWRAPHWYRSHEGIDIDLHEARGKSIHPIVAVEDGPVEWVVHNAIDPNQACVCQRSATDPHIAYVYQHLNWPTVEVHKGQLLTKGQQLATIWGDNVWGHLHFAVTNAPETNTYELRYTALLNCFPQMYELWHGDTDPRDVRYSEGDFHFGLPKQDCGNRLKFFAYDDVVGYGWDLGDWCPARAVERGAVVRRTLHPNTPAQARNPKDHYDFLIRVHPGTYLVQAQVGSARGPSWQKVHFSDEYAGTFDLHDGGLLWTGSHEVAACDGWLRVRLRVRGEDEAGLGRLRFWVAGGEQREARDE